MLRGITRKKGRTAMTLIAVISAMALLISMLSVAEGIRQNAIRDIEEGKVDISVSPYGDHSLYDAHEIFWNMTSWEEVKSTEVNLYVFRSLMPVANISGNYVPFGCVGLLPKYGLEMMSADEKERFHGWFTETSDPYDDPYYSDGTYSGPFTGEIIV